MRQNIIRNAFLYRPWETIRFTVRLNRVVKAMFLDQAVQLAAERYPYLCVKVCRQGDHYEILFNDSPISVTGSRRPVMLGSEEAGGHYLAVGFEGDYLFFDVYHYLCDTKGLVPFIKTVLYLYLKSTVDADLDPVGIRLPGEAQLPHETEDPYDSLEIPDDLQPLYSWKFSDCFVPDRRYAKGSARYNCVVKASANMKEAYVCCTVLSAPLFVQITALNDAFWFCFLQRDETDIYAKTFVEILKENGVAAELTDTFYEEKLSGYIP